MSYRGYVDLILTFLFKRTEYTRNKKNLSCV